MSRLARSLGWAAIAVAPIAGCSVEVVDQDEGSRTGGSERIDSTQQALYDGMLQANLYSKYSNGTRYRGTDADYLLCTGQPFNMYYTFSNVGDNTWRDVEGRGDKHGSDIKLVSLTGGVDPLFKRTYASVNENLNNVVAGEGSGADWCTTKPGCRRTRFMAAGFWAIAPSVPGVYASRWRLRDYSKASEGTSDGFGPKVGIRWKVIDCSLSCGCLATCSDGQTKEVTANESNCVDVSKAMCSPAVYVTSNWIPCPIYGSGGTGGTTGSGGSGGVGGSGSGGTSGVGGSGTGGSGWPTGGTGGIGGGGTGGSGATGSGGSSGGLVCGGTTCTLPQALEGQATLCCAGSSCGVTTASSTGQCVPMYSSSSEEEPPGAIYGNDPEDPESPENEPPEEAGYIEPSDALESDGQSSGGGVTEKSGCSLTTTGASSGAAGLAALALIGLFARRRRR
jgi:MYXO-CTERM domain-containing protein